MVDCHLARLNAAADAAAALTIKIAFTLDISPEFRRRITSQVTNESPGSRRRAARSDAAAKFAPKSCKAVDGIGPIEPSARLPAAARPVVAVPAPLSKA